MEFLVVLAVGFAAVMALRTPLKKWPVVFYLLACGVCIFFLMSGSLGLPVKVNTALIHLIRRCLVPLALFVIVMFVGVLPTDSRLNKWLRPIRGELSIVAWILCLGHMMVYLQAYLPALGHFSMLGINVRLSLVVALALFVLLMLLSVTSFRFIHSRMKPSAWKALQRWSYLFFGLVYVHLCFMLAPAALGGAAGPLERLVVYTVIFAAYLVLRLVRAKTDARQ